MNEEPPINKDDIRNPPSVEDMNVVYANNTHFDATVWDMQVIFGEYSPRVNSVDWHTTVTMPWAQAKLMSYYLQFQINVYEQGHGPIKIAKQLIPDALPAATDPNDERETHLRTKLSMLRETFLASLEDEANPKK